MNRLQKHLGKIIFISTIVLFFSYIGYRLYHIPATSLEEKFLLLMKEDGYIILFAWSILEGEMGLIMAGVLSHMGDMSLEIAIFIAGLGGFTGDQIYFYISRYNKDYVHTRFKNKRRHFARANLLLRRYGWVIIFFQRYMYGMRTIIPISIGLTHYSAKKFAFINLISAWCWAAITIIPAWYFGEEILSILDRIKGYFIFIVPLFLILFWLLIRSFHREVK